MSEVCDVRRTGLPVYRFEWGKDPSGDGPYHSVIKRDDPASDRIYRELLRALSAAVERYVLIEPMIIGWPIRTDSSATARYYLVSWSENVSPTNVRPFTRTRALMADVEALRCRGMDFRVMISRGRWQAPGWAPHPSVPVLCDKLVPIPTDRPEVASMSQDSANCLFERKLDLNLDSLMETMRGKAGPLKRELPYSESVEALWQIMDGMDLDERLESSFALGIPGNDVELPIKPRLVFVSTADERAVPPIEQGLGVEKLAHSLMRIIPEHPRLPELWRQILFNEAAEIAMDPDGRTLDRIRNLLTVADERQWLASLPKKKPANAFSTDKSDAAFGAPNRAASDAETVDLEKIRALQSNVSSIMPEVFQKLREPWLAMNEVERASYLALSECALDLLGRLEPIVSTGSSGIVPLAFVEAPKNVMAAIRQDRSRLIGILRAARGCVGESHAQSMSTWWERLSSMPIPLPSPSLAPPVQYGSSSGNPPATSDARSFPNRDWSGMSGFLVGFAVACMLAGACLAVFWKLGWRSAPPSTRPASAAQQSLNRR